MTSHKELSIGASQAQQAEIAKGIGRMNRPAVKPHAQGLLPDVFTSEPSRCHPSLEDNLTHQWPLVNGERSKQEFLSIDSGFTADTTSLDNAELMPESPEFITQPESHTRELVVVPVGVLVPHSRGRYATTAEIEQARDEKGLEPVCAETAYQILLQHGNKIKDGDTIWMNMKPKAGRDGDPDVVAVGRDDGGLWLGCGWTEPSDEWGPGSQFAFFLPQVTANA